MRAGAFFVALFALALIVGPYAAAGEKTCDVKTTKTVKLCGACDSQSDKAECCSQKTSEVELCVKKQFSCEGCGKTAAKQGKCCADKPMAKVDNTAKTFYACPGCAMKADKGAHCDKCDKDVVKTCEKSGEAPHVVSAKKSEGKAKEKKAG